MEGYTTVKQYGTFEYEDRKSVFIGEALPVSTEAEALEFLASVKKKYPDARHHVYAYVLRDNFTMRFSDDSEPQGTAGMPVLDVIRKRGCTDVIIVVTRYFGGTLLGTGGLVRAYTAAAVGALEQAQIIRYDIYSTVSIEVGYPDYSRISSALAEHGFRVEDTDFSENVTVLGTLPKTDADRLVAALTEITSGRGAVEILGEKFDF
jgi:uncharacterized YigZ family protein